MARARRDLTLHALEVGQLLAGRPPSGPSSRVALLDDRDRPIATLYLPERRQWAAAVVIASAGFAPARMLGTFRVNIGHYRPGEYAPILDGIDDDPEARPAMLAQVVDRAGGWTSAHGRWLVDDDGTGRWDPNPVVVDSDDPAPTMLVIEAGQPFMSAGFAPIARAAFIVSDRYANRSTSEDVRKAAAVSTLHGLGCPAVILHQ